MSSPSTSGTPEILEKLANFLSIAPKDRRKSDYLATHEDIQALRTMLTLLSLLQHVKPPDPASELPSTPIPTDIQCKELKVLSALATLLVMEHERVAVVAKNGNARRRNVEVFACTDQISAVKNLNTDSSSISFLKSVWNLLVTKNPRDNAELETSGSYPIIYNPKQSPDHPKDVTLDKLQADVKNHW